jgi:hypothetical protein
MRGLYAAVSPLEKIKREKESEKVREGMSERKRREEGDEGK